MKRMLGLMQNLPRREFRLRHLGLLVLLGAFATLGIRHASPPTPGTAKAPNPSKPDSSVQPFHWALSKLRPRVGDRMTLPRIGFRWTFEAGGGSTATQASLVPPFLSDTDSMKAAGTEAVRFLLHLVGPGGKPEIVKETTTQEIRLDLKNGFPVGECEWWVEALLPGGNSVCSDRQRFVLKP
jgi:hypothetical protein